MLELQLAQVQSVKPAACMNEVGLTKNSIGDWNFCGEPNPYRSLDPIIPPSLQNEQRPQRIFFPDSRFLQPASRGEDNISCTHCGHAGIEWRSICA